MEGQKDDLKWFGEGFDGFPKRLPEDTVEYMLLIIDISLTQRELLTSLEAVRQEALKLTNKLLKEYIWQRDEFQLELVVDNNTGKLFNCLKYLRGTTNYGDSVEDEWLIVYLLKEISKSFKDLWIKIVDTDGEFLLIEAANALPRWLNPEIADNRVWINNNRLRIIPLTAAPASLQNTKTKSVSRPLTQAEAHGIISNSPQTIIHSPLMEAEAFYRLRNYPDQISSSLHYARVTIPRKLAYFIHECPTSISAAVEAFYLRDPIALKPLQSTTSTLTLAPEDLITISVRFTKVLYAQLKSQQFSPPVAWKPVISQSEKDIKTNPEHQSELPRLELGMKVTSGYEMLLSDTKNADNRSVRSLNILMEDLAEGQVLPSDAEVSAWKDGQREDSESWLDINFEDFEKELAGKNGGERKGPNDKKGAFGPHKMEGFGDAKTQDDLRKMVQRFEAFMNDEDAGVDGAEEVDEMDFDDDDDDEDDDDSEDEDKEVSFDEQEFARMMREMMGLPSEEANENEPSKKGQGDNASGRGKGVRFEEVDSDDSEEDDEAEEMRKVMARIEAELNEAGALDLDPTPKKLASLKSKADSKTAYGSEAKGKGPMVEEDVGDSDEEVNIDFNLAKNLLESFKSQAGMAGPGGNMMGMFGMQFPRDEGDDDENIKAGQVGKRFG